MQLMASIVWCKCDDTETHPCLEVHDAMDNNGLTPDVDYGVAGFQERARGKP
jgi:hypothetical protein